MLGFDSGEDVRSYCKIHTIILHEIVSFWLKNDLGCDGDCDILTARYYGR